MKTIKIVFFTIIYSIFLTSFAFATPSPNWYQENGRYKLKDNAGNIITNAWVCDDVDDGKPWYLLDLYGNMVAGLALDNGSWYFLGTNGQLLLNSDYYNGVYLDIDHSLGIIKNIENITSLIIKFGGSSITYVNTNKSAIYTSSLNNSTVPSNSNFNQILDNNLLDGATAVALGRQLGVAKGLRIEELGYKDHGIIVHGDMGDFVTIIDDYPNIVCSFVDAKNHNWAHSQQQRTIKNIQEAIKRLAKF